MCNATEGGATGSYTLKLNSPPTAPVTISFDAGNQISAIAAITFDATNSNVAKPVTVTATDDAAVEGAHTGAIGHTSTSNDVKYNSITISPVNVAITDNDTSPTPTPTPPTPITASPTPITPTPTPSATPAGITVNPASGLITTESGGTATFNVTLNSQPTADVKIDLGSSNTAEEIVSPVSLTFNSGNWNAAQTVTVTGVNDNVADGNKPYTIVTAPAVSTDNNYNGLNAADVAVTNYTTAADRIAPFSQRNDQLTTVFAPRAPITGADLAGDCTTPSGAPINTYHGSRQATAHIGGIAVLAQQLAQQELGRRLTPTEFANLLKSTGVTIKDVDPNNTNDNVTNTGLDFKRVDVLALAGAIIGNRPPQ
jgi:hypothetical protein